MQAHAAELLGIKKNVMQHKMKKFTPDELRTAHSDRIDVDRFIRPQMGLNETLEEVERQMIRRALDQAGHVQTQAADLLGIDKRVLQYN